jgi:hypothetical protein
MSVTRDAYGRVISYVHQKYQPVTECTACHGSNIYPILNSADSPMRCVACGTTMQTRHVGSVVVEVEPGGERLMGDEPGPWPGPPVDDHAFYPM